MSWAIHYIKELQDGKTVQFRPRGNSMTGKIESGQLCTIKPIQDHSTLKKGDIVLCQVKSRHYLHLIKAISGDRFQIGNNKGRINGWVRTNALYGRLIFIEP